LLIIHSQLFFCINADTCELDCQHLSATTSGGGSGWFCECLQKVWLNNTFKYSTVSMDGGLGFVPVVMVVERGVATGALGLHQMLRPVLLCCIVCHLGENDS
jgi:hypothetical protein